MAPSRATSEPGADAAEGEQSPICLDAIEAAGAVKAGVRVQKVVIHYADGRVCRYELPVPAAVKDWTRTKPGRAILRVLADESRGLKGSTIAKLADYPYNGSFREALKGLEDQGKLERTDDGYCLA